MAVRPAAWSRSAGDAERAELQIPGRAEPVQGAQQPGAAAYRGPLQGNVSTADDYCAFFWRQSALKVSQIIQLVGTLLSIPP